MTLARPEALWLLAALPLIALAGVWFGWRLGRMMRPVLLLRVIIVALLVLGLAEPLLATGGQASSTIFVVDRSRSLAGDSQTAANRWITDALGSAAPGSRAAIVTFAAEPNLTTETTAASQISDDWTNPDTGAEAGLNPDFTDLESALALARALPVGNARRIVLVSDGAENTGRGLDQAAQAALDGTPIDVLPLDGVGATDLRVEGVTVPASSWSGDPITILTSVQSGVAGPGRVELWVDGLRSAVTEVELPAGSSSHAFELTGLAAGFHALEVRVAGPTAGDRFVENNVYPAGHIVRDLPRILLIAAADSDSGVIRGALTRGGARVEVIEPLDLPARLSVLSEYDAIVLDNVPASAFTIDQVAALREVTGSLGRGLVVLGGTSSFGPGAYAGSDLEELLPVTVRATDGRQRQRVALLLVMDKSGSMSYDPLGSVAKIDMAKEAARLAARSLVPGDQIGVLMFNDKQEWVVPFTVLDDDSSQQVIDEQIAAITSTGGTELLPALAVGLDAIRNTDAEVRHIVLLSDGKSRSGTRDSYQRLIDDARDDRTTLSTIATGDDADIELLQFLANQGRGRYHFTNRPGEIPVLTVEEAESAGSQSVIRGSFLPIQTEPSPILSGFAPAELPLLDGYGFVEAKPDAQVILTSDREDPVLAKWQFGLGRVVAWTADNGVDLAAGWTGWDRAGDFWSAMVRWSLPDPEQRPLMVTITNDGPEATINVDSMATGSTASSFATTTATITSPTGAVLSDQAMTQSGPGQFQLQLPAPEAGAYQIEIAQDRGGEVITELASFAVPASPELQPAPGAPALLDAIAARTGGRLLSLDDPGQVFAVTAASGTSLQEFRPLWYLPLSVALLLFVVEIALRMGITRAVLAKALSWRPGRI
ncbi:MAG: VWA domain-containing protein [Chloroflexota bacterium]|nr:VWA domain-containing protein [Chloroflexota bacterium]